MDETEICLLLYNLTYDYIFQHNCELMTKCNTQVLMLKKKGFDKKPIQCIMVC